MSAVTNPSLVQGQNVTAGASQRDGSSTPVDAPIPVASNDSRTPDPDASAGASRQGESSSAINDPIQIANDNSRRPSAGVGQHDGSLSVVTELVHTAGDAARPTGLIASAGASQRNDTSEPSSDTLHDVSIGGNESANGAERKLGPSDEANPVTDDDKDDSRDLSQFLARHYVDCIAGTSTGG